MKTFFLLMLAMCGSMLIYTLVSDPIGYKVGDCLSIGNEDYVYKVTEVGRYGVKTLTPAAMDGYQEFYVSQQNLAISKKMDCFGLFKE